MARTKQAARKASHALPQNDNNKKAKLDDDTILEPIPVIPHVFKRGDYQDGCAPKTQLEMKLMALSAAIRSKPKWYEKMEDNEIVERWKQEANKQQRATRKMIQYVFDELKYYKELRDGTVEPSTVDGVWQSDGLIPDDLKRELSDNVTQLL
jgi:hypothetical protein